MINMKTVCTLLMLMVMTVFMASFALSVSSTWETFGNNGSMNLNYQNLKNDYALGHLANVSVGMSRQPLVVDLDGDGDSEVPIMYNNKLDIYDAETLTILDDFNTGMWFWSTSTSDIILDVVDWDSDGYAEILVITGDSGDQTQGYFQEYQWTGSSLTLEASFKISDAFSNINQMKCQVDFNHDGNVDCLFLAESKTNTSLTTLVGIDKDTTDTTSLAINISLSPANPTINGNYKPLQFVDADRDGDLEVLYSDTSIWVFNETGFHISISKSTLRSSLNIGTPNLDAVWYQSGVGDYEVASVGLVNMYSAGGAEYRDVALHIHDMDGNEIDETLVSDDCPHSSTTLGGGVYNSETSISLAGVQGQNLFIWSYIYIQNRPDVYTVCKYDNSLNRIIQSNTLSYSSDNFYGVQFVQADLIGDSEDELISLKGIIDIDTGTPSNFLTGGSGWCTPVDIDADNRLELICTEQDTITILYDEEATGGGLVNDPAELEQLTIDATSLTIGDTLTARVYAYDEDMDTYGEFLQCAVNYDYQGDDDLTVAECTTCNTGSCEGEVMEYQYNENGTYTIRAYAISGTDALTILSTDLSGWDYTDINGVNNRTIQVGDTHIACHAPYIFCDPFSYTSPLVVTDWFPYTGNSAGVDNVLAPDGTSLSLAGTTDYSLWHALTPHTNPVLTTRFDVDMSYNGRFEFTLRYRTDAGDYVQGYLILKNNTVYYTNEGSSEGDWVSIGNYENDTTTRYTLYHYYESIAGGINGTSKESNIYDIYQDGNLLASDISFFHSTDVYGFEITEFYEYYSNLFLFQTDNANVTLDEIYIFKGTSEDYDNTFDLLVSPEISGTDYEDISEYWGCYKVKGIDTGYDCTYPKYNCQKCCNYVDDELVVTKLGCTFGRMVSHGAQNTRNWFFSNIWYFVFFGGLLIVGILLFRKVRCG